MTTSIKIKFCFIFFMCVYYMGFSQETIEKNDNDMYSAFHQFFDAEIRRQGVKGNWIFELDEITGLHTFDMDNDGLKEALFEFDAVPVEGGGVVYSYAVLFLETTSDSFKMANYLETPDKRFLNLDGKEFQFYNKRKDMTESYLFKNNKFIKK